MNGRVVGAKLFRRLEFSGGVILASFAFVDRSQVDMGDCDRRLQSHSALKVGHRLLGMIEPNFGIAEIRQREGVFRVVCEFRSEGLFRFVEFQRLP